MTIRCIVCVVLLTGLAPAAARGQEHRWAADGSLGYAGFVDDATKGYALVSGALRRYVSPRVSVGPELVVMWNAGLLSDRAVMLTGNVVIDFGSSPPEPFAVTPFVVGGLGVFWGRDLVRGGPYWSNDPAFTGGGGLRVRLGRHVAAAAEYRIGWELHQRVNGAVAVGW